MSRLINKYLSRLGKTLGVLSLTMSWIAVSAMPAMAATSVGTNISTDGTLSIGSTLTATGDIDFSDTSADTISLSDANDTVSILGDITVTDGQWSVSAAGAATFASISGPLTGNVTGNVTGNAGTVTNGVYTTGAGTVFLAPASIAAAYQSLDSDLTAIAALTTTAFGRGLLDDADAAAVRTTLGLGTAALSATGDFATSGHNHTGTYQPLDSDLTSIAALTTTAFGRGLLAETNAASARTTLGLGTAAQSATGDFADAVHNHNSTYLALGGGTLTGGLTISAGGLNLNAGAIANMGVAGAGLTRAGAHSLVLTTTGTTNVTLPTSGTLEVTSHNHSGTYQPVVTSALSFVDGANATISLATNTAGAGENLIIKAQPGVAASLDGGQVHIVGGYPNNTTPGFVRIGDGTFGTSQDLSMTPGSLYIEQGLEVDNAARFDGTLTVSSGTAYLEGGIDINSSAFAVDSSGNVSAGSLSLGGDLSVAFTAGITASTTQTQGQQPLTDSISEVSTVANSGDVVTLPSAMGGICIKVINNGANPLAVYPASGDDLGQGVNTATTLGTGVNIEFCAYNSTNWEQF